MRTPGKPTIVGVIADTHGLVRPQALDALVGADLIVHAGDVGGPHVLGALAEIAPVTSVRGNVDRAPWAGELPETAAVAAGPVWLYVLHDIKQLDLDPTGVFAAVIAGHSHHPAMEEREGVLFFNPGSAGPRRFRLPVCVGRLTVLGSRVTGELIELSI